MELLSNKWFISQPECTKTLTFNDNSLLGKGFISKGNSDSSDIIIFAGSGGNAALYIIRILYNRVDSCTKATFSPVNS